MAIPLTISSSLSACLSSSNTLVNLLFSVSRCSLRAASLSARPEIDDPHQCYSFFVFRFFRFSVFSTMFSKKNLFRFFKKQKSKNPNTKKWWKTFLKLKFFLFFCVCQDDFKATYKLNSRSPILQNFYWKHHSFLVSKFSVKKDLRELRWKDLLIFKKNLAPLISKCFMGYIIWLFSLFFIILWQKEVIVAGLKPFLFF